MTLATRSARELPTAKTVVSGLLGRVFTGQADDGIAETKDLAKCREHSHDLICDRADPHHTADKAAAAAKQSPGLLVPIVSELEHNSCCKTSQADCAEHCPPQVVILFCMSAMLKRQYSRNARYAQTDGPKMHCAAVRCGLNARVSHSSESCEQHDASSS